MDGKLGLLFESTGINPTLLTIIIIWSLIWMGLAMWKAAKRDHKIWFVIFLIVHTVGILEILYIYIFSELGKGKTNIPRKRKEKLEVNTKSVRPKKKKR